MKKYIIGCILILLSSLPAMADSASSAPSYIFNISYEDAQDAIGKALSEKMSEESENKKITAVINGRKLTPLYSHNKPVNVEVRGLRADSQAGSWSASMVISEDDKVISALPLSGRYMVMNDVPVIKRPLRNGDVIKESDVEIKSFPQERTHNDTIRDVAELIGRQPLRALSPNRPIRSSEVSAPSVIKKNALVQMRYKTASMEITTAGQALEDGAKGDVIEVRNSASKKTTRAVVTDSSTVDVLAQAVQTSQVEAAYAKQ